jgi:hypothetical protein
VGNLKGLDIHILMQACSASLLASGGKILTHVHVHNNKWGRTRD